MAFLISQVRFSMGAMVGARGNWCLEDELNSFGWIQGMARRQEGRQAGTTTTPTTTGMRYTMAGGQGVRWAFFWSFWSFALSVVNRALSGRKTTTTTTLGIRRQR